MEITKEQRENYIKTTLKTHPSCKLLLYFDYIKRTNKIPYNPVSSKSQLKQIVNNPQLHKLINKFVLPNTPIHHIIKTSKNDEEIYNKLLKHSKSKTTPSPLSPTYIPVSQLKTRCGRDIMQAEEIVHQISTYIPDLKPPFNYIDIGCGTCIKSLYIGELLNLPKTHIYGADISEWFSYNAKNMPPDINFIEYEKNNPLPIEKAKFKLVSALYTLHHVEGLKLILNEINRILEMGGYLFITEHDVATNVDKILCDVEHGLQAIFNDNDKDFFNKYYATYYDWIDWDIIMSLHGFKYIKANYILDHKNEQSPTRKYYGIYQKITNS